MGDFLINLVKNVVVTNKKISKSPFSFFLKTSLRKKVMGLQVRVYPSKNVWKYGRMSFRIIIAIETKTSVTTQNQVFDFGQFYVYFGPECFHVAKKF